MIRHIVDTVLLLGIRAASGIWLHSRHVSDTLLDETLKKIKSKK